MISELLASPLADRYPLVRPADVGGMHAWQAILHEGHLTVLWGQNAVPARYPVQPSDRALALASEVYPDTVIGRQSALWVHSGMLTSSMVHLLYSPGQHRPSPVNGRSTHQANLSDDDTVDLAGVLVTTPTRTALDLALHLPREAAFRALRTLVGHGLTTRDQILARLDALPLRARRTEAHDVITRSLR